MFNAVVLKVGEITPVGDDFEEQGDKKKQRRR